MKPDLTTFLFRVKQSKKSHRKTNLRQRKDKSRIREINQKEVRIRNQKERLSQKENKRRKIMMVNLKEREMELIHRRKMKL